MTFKEAVDSANADCLSLSDKIKHIKVMLEAMEEAIYSSIGQGGIIEYRVDTGQTVIKVEASSLDQLRKQYRELWAWYNELCGIKNGSNVMVMRDGGTLRR